MYYPPQLIWPQNLFRMSVNLYWGQSLGNTTSDTLSNVWPLILKGKMRYEIVVLFHYGAFYVIFPICLLSSRVKFLMWKNDNYERNVWAYFVGSVIYNQFLYPKFYVLICFGFPGAFLFVCLEYLGGR